jgi:hypothetical protein
VAGYETLILMTPHRLTNAEFHALPPWVVEQDKRGCGFML